MKYIILVKEKNVMFINFLNEFIFSMFQYAKETQHEKILRGLAVGISFIMYGQLENADDLVRDLCEEKVSRVLQPEVGRKWRYGLCCSSVIKSIAMEVLGFRGSTPITFMTSLTV